MIDRHQRFDGLLANDWSHTYWASQAYVSRCKVEGFDGRVYRLELELVENDGDWQIIGASWERSLEAFRGD